MQQTGRSGYGIGWRGQDLDDAQVDADEVRSPAQGFSS
jgi:hypothetical protein